MNSKPTIQLRLQRARRGIALVITLLLLVLLSAFAVAFFTRMSVEQASATSYADGVTTRQLAESAVGLIESQIREATTVVNGAWGSQPGMIRTFARTQGTTTVAGKDPYAYYKLYSSDDMTITEPGKLQSFDPADEINPNWATERALWTDLNEPVLLKFANPADTSTSVEVKRYPIFDPDLAADSDNSSPTTLSVHNTTPEVKVEGYTIDSQDTTTGHDNPRGRMPVRWIYVLRDGTLTTPTRSEEEGLQAVWESSGGDPTKVPTKANPIVGRLAFWTDDDTSKVNINTAGGFTTKDVVSQYDPQNNKTFSNYAGSFWDTPRFFTRFERGQSMDRDNFGEFAPGAGGLAISQPPANEFQRFPGHPATTSLGLLFNRTVKPDGSIDPNTPRLNTQQLYRLLPRIKPGGSEGGTDRHIAYNNTLGNSDLSDQVMELKSQRLYATVDEFFFAASQNPGKTRRLSVNEFLRDPDNDDIRNPIAGLTEELINQNDLNEFQAYRFLLTAHSRAPEMNLFGRPRVSIWPTWASGGQGSADYSTRRNPIDRLMVFSSTLGPVPRPTASGAQPAGKLFMFQRWNPYSPTDDAAIERNNVLLKQYLTGTAANPGLTEQPIPGFTSSSTHFATKYNNTGNNGSRDQILTQIFDYIRSGVNLRDTWWDKTVSQFPYHHASTTAAQRVEMDKYRYAPRGIVIPSSIQYRTSGGKQTAGFGRFSTISEVSLVFYHAGYKDSQGRYFFDPREKNRRGIITEHLMRMFIMVETFNPMQGYSRTYDTTADDRNKTPDRLTHFLQLNSAASVTLADGTPQNFVFQGGQLTNEIRFRSGSFTGGNDAAGMESTLHTFGLRMEEPSRGQADIPPDPVQGVDHDRLTEAYMTGSQGIYPFQSYNAIRIPVLPGGVEQTTCGFSGLSATLRVRFGTQDLQVIKLDFPSTTIPIPTDAYWEDPGGFAWPNPDVTPTHSMMSPTWSAGNTTETRNWPWGSTLGTPAAMKSLAHRIWWINGTWFNRSGLDQRADSDNVAKFDSLTGAELFGDGRGYRFTNRWRNIIQPGDVVRSLVPAPAASTDLRTIALNRFDPASTIVFEPLRPDGGGSGYDDPTLRHVRRLRSGATGQPYEPANNSTAGPQSQLLRNGGGTPFVFSSADNSNLANYGPSQNNPTVTAFAIEPVTIRRGPTQPPIYAWERKSYGTVGNNIAFGNLAELPSGFKVGDYGTRAGELPAKQNGRSVNGVERFGTSGIVGDFDTGYGDKPDGSLVNKPDEGHLVWRVARGDLGRPADVSISEDWNYQYPYFTGNYIEEAADTFFAPTRQIPSAVMFGSLLAGAKTGWQTLCFSPNPSSLKANGGFNADRSVKGNHPGMDVEPKDHLLLDLFQMPVVEPYAITEPFSTAGKINLNCEIVPFNYIRRTTALRAALHPLRVTAVNSDQVRKYKQVSTAAGSAYGDNENYRIPLNRDETIKGIMGIIDDPNRANAADRFYRSASQICERFLYPTNTSVRLNTPGPKWSRNETEIKLFWEQHNLGGDNTREKPYADLYPRLTTKSNTYTVHVRVQKLRPQKGREEEDFLIWHEREDVVAAEYRGEVQIERYLDPQDRRFDLADPTVAPEDRFNVDATVYRTALPATRPLEHAYRFRTVSSKRFAPTR